MRFMCINDKINNDIIFTQYTMIRNFLHLHNNTKITVLFLKKFSKANMAKSTISDLRQIFKSSVSAVLPENLIRKSIKFDVTNQQLNIAGKNYNLQQKNLYLVGFGKAVQNMAIEVENILNTQICEGIISIPVGSLVHKKNKSNVTYCEGAQNNLPDADAVSTARKIKELVTKLGGNDLLLVLISGGGSALLPLPKDPITIEEKTRLIKQLGNSGADITELNSVRKRISDVKGGQLAIKAQPAEVVSLILSDIVGDPLDLIASGPTTEDEDNQQKALEIIKKYELYDVLPPSIKEVLKKEKSKGFPNHNVKNHIIGSNKLSIAAAYNKAKELNYWPLEISNQVTGNVKIVAEKYVELTNYICQFVVGQLDTKLLEEKLENLEIPGLVSNLPRQLSDACVVDKDLCLIFGGEITVEVKGNGKGGRNQQLALEFSRKINKIKDSFDNFDVNFLSAGTDGIDGPTDAAGAMGHKNLILDAKKKGIDVYKYLDNNDSYNFYKNYREGDLHVITGHTNTNVMDIHLIIIRRINK